MEYIAFVLRITIAVIFLVAAVAKAKNFRGFIGTIRQIPIMSKASTATAVVVIVSEFAVTVLLLSGQLFPLGAALAAALLLMFSTVAIAAVAQSRSIECGCFGPSRTSLGLNTVARNVILLGATAEYSLAARTSSTWLPMDVVTLTPLLLMTLGILVVSRVTFGFFDERLAAIGRQRRSHA